MKSASLCAFVDMLECALQRCTSSARLQSTQVALCLFCGISSVQL